MDHLDTTDLCPPRARSMVPGAVVMLCGLAAVAGGCGQRVGVTAAGWGTLAPEGVVLPSAGAVVAEFRPRAVRVHPLSRADRAGGSAVGDGDGDGGAWRVVVHVELLDGQGQSVKWPGVLGVGVLGVGVLGAGSVSEGAWAGPGVVEWRDLTLADGNGAAWDVVTRTYVVRRRVAGLGEGPGGGVAVRVWWVQGDGRGESGPERLADQRVITLDR
jgi:hypothetical protein